jgi:lipopolysaccharide/colanic/teichoic acid biosynthesis glycosyltransferase
VFEPPLSYCVAKRTLDVVVATVALIALAPLMSLIAVLVWAGDPGAPVLFRQIRCGQGGRGFQMLKFRTMVRDADALKERLRERSSVAWPDFRLEHDPRVTRIGRFLRKSSLDSVRTSAPRTVSSDRR